LSAQSTHAQTSWPETNDAACSLPSEGDGRQDDVQPYSNCDGIGGLTANDLVCFINAYAAGCP
jgi:hypothetical protein